MRFSIIIPVYNVEKYIARCMESVMGQTFRDFEVIVVDDESPDNSMQIVEEFAARYPGQIQMIHQKNTRQGGARNRGVREAKGEYILFVDSDDYVSTDMLAVVDARLREHPCDILVFQHMVVTEDGKKLRMGTFGGVTPGRYIPKRDKNILTLPCEPWKKAFSRSFYLESGMAFPEKMIYEDSVMRLLYARASEIVICEDCLYYYVQSSNSTIRQKPSERMLDILKVTDIVTERFKQDGLYGEFRQELDAVLLDSVLFVFNLINKAEKDSPLQERFSDYIGQRFSDLDDNPCISSGNKAAAKCVIARDYGRYHYRFLMKLEFLEWLLRCPAIAWLSRLRKQLRQGKRG